MGATRIAILPGTHERAARKGEAGWLVSGTVVTASEEDNRKGFLTSSNARPRDAEMHVNASVCR
jgi:hypothetical protein